MKNQVNLFSRFFSSDKDEQVQQGATLPQEGLIETVGESALVKSLCFLRNVVHARLNHHFGRTNNFAQPEFSFIDDGSVFARYVIDNKFSIEEFLLVLLALAPHAHPDLFSDLIKVKLPKGGDFPEFGGVRGVNYRGIMPTGETALFVLAGMNLDHRHELMRWFINDQCAPFAKGLLYLESGKDQEPEMSARLIISPEKVTEFITGSQWVPEYSLNFPATLLHTDMQWEDLVLPTTTQRELAMIRFWLDHHDTLDADPNLGKRTRPGYRALFHGPPGTGKTLTATLLGKLFNMKVFRIDLSMIVSKYIGETEKNLQYIFDKAAHKNWILFFDEADALFGKRTNVQSSHDRFANQEVSYLLQKVEDHAGLVILATNFKSNLDQAFGRRFQSMINFQMPDVQERKKLWSNAFPVNPRLSLDVDVDQLALQYEVSGAAIVNVVQMAALKALSENRTISRADLTEGLRKEYAKDGKTF